MTHITPHTLTLLVAAVVIYSGATVSLYIDGALNASGPDSTTFSTGLDYWIGGAPGYSEHFDGLIDDVRIYNRALSATEIKQLYNLGTAKIGHSNIAISNGLVGYWPLDGAVTDWNTNTTRDLSGNGNTGSLGLMSTTSSPTPGKIGQAMYFSGSNGVSVPSNSSLEIGGTHISVFAWVKPVTCASTPTIISKNANATNYQLGLDTPATDCRIRVCLGGFGCTSDTVTFPAGTWNNIGFTNDGSSLRFYLNGTLHNVVANTASMPTDAGDALYIGAATNTVWNFTGAIDDARVYNRTLSATEIKQLYTLGTAQLTSRTAMR